MRWTTWPVWAALRWQAINLSLAGRPTAHIEPTAATKRNPPSVCGSLNSKTESSFRLPGVKQMAEAQRQRRADAERNFARVLEAAFEVFSEQGTSAPITAIAERAGVGPGTIYRHFPTKEDLFRAVVTDRFQAVVNHGRALLASAPAGAALFGYLRVLITGGTENHALADAIIGSEFDVVEAESPFVDVLADLLRAAQAAGEVRTDIGVMEVKALLGACYLVRTYGEQYVEPMMTVVFDGLRTVTR